MGLIFGILYVSKNLRLNFNPVVNWVCWIASKSPTLYNRCVFLHFYISLFCMKCLDVFLYLMLSYEISLLLKHSHSSSSNKCQRAMFSFFHILTPVNIKMVSILYFDWSYCYWFPKFCRMYKLFRGVINSQLRKCWYANSVNPLDLSISAENTRNILHMIDAFLSTIAIKCLLCKSGYSIRYYPNRISKRFWCSYDLASCSLVELDLSEYNQLNNVNASTTIKMWWYSYSSLLKVTVQWKQHKSSRKSLLLEWDFKKKNLFHIFC